MLSTSLGPCSCPMSNVIIPCIIVGGGDDDDDDDDDKRTQQRTCRPDDTRIHQLKDATYVTSSELSSTPRCKVAQGLVHVHSSTTHSKEQQSVTRHLCHGLEAKGEGERYLGNYESTARTKRDDCEKVRCGMSSST